MWYICMDIITHIQKINFIKEEKVFYDKYKKTRN